MISKNKKLKRNQQFKNSGELKSKDVWDKLGILAQIISGILLAAFGLYITWSIGKNQADLTKQISNSQRESAQSISNSQNETQARLEESRRKSTEEINKSQIDATTNNLLAQTNTQQKIADAQTKTSSAIADAQTSTSKAIADAQTKTSKDVADAQIKSQEVTQQLDNDTKYGQIAGGYLERLTASTTKTNERVALLDLLDVPLPPKFSIPIAIRLTRPLQMKAEICNGGEVKQLNELDIRGQNATISQSVKSLLQRLRLKDTKLMEQYSQSNSLLEAGVAQDISGKRSPVLFRVSEIDDYADVYVNDIKVDTYTFANDSGWVDITDMIIPDKRNVIFVIVRNGPYESTGTRLQIQAGAEQSDRMVTRKDWTVEGEAFWIATPINVDKFGKTVLLWDEIRSLGSPGVIHACDKEFIASTN
jgi:hypothetical protein